ncbi:hypothetical protein ACFFHC_06925 [Kytococcus schroeteri]|uniref:hypothetical protein n=1 Tax=Kytococcus schroeteri TaxID=138300 RepID=UPI0035EDA093
MGKYLAADDLAAFVSIDPARAAAMIEDAEAQAVLAAPCLADPGFTADPQRVALVKSILRGAVLRWHDAGSGSVVQETTGPFSRTIDTKTARRGMFWPDEIAQLRDLCAAFTGESGDGRAFQLDTTPNAGWRAAHTDRCPFTFGAERCTCGALLAT